MFAEDGRKQTFHITHGLLCHNSFKFIPLLHTFTFQLSLAICYALAYVALVFSYAITMNLLLQHQYHFFVSNMTYVATLKEVLES